MAGESWPKKWVRDGRQDWWEVDFKNWLEVGCWSLKQVGDGRLSSKAGGRWEVPSRHTDIVSTLKIG